jgi:iron complex transport system permease protein
MPRPVLLTVFLLLVPASLVAGLMFGGGELSPAGVARALLGEPGLAHDIVWQLRLPRALSAFACGGLLALAGALLQVLLRNPLADPYILGVSGGAAVGALSAMLLGLAAAAVNLAALAGAAGAVGLVFALSLGGTGWNLYRLLLTGVVLSAGFGALISLLLTLAPEAGVRGMLFWLMGDLSRGENPGLAWGVLLAAAGFAIWQSRSLDALGLGELKAKALGVPVGPLQYGVYFIASAVTAAAVLQGGTIGFVGLIVPHGVRLLGVTAHRWLVPLSVLAGGSFLTVADTLARAVVAPQQLPVGVLTALLGVPLLLLLLARRH